jgi:RND family efflux transporter MFP subunit
MESVMEAHPKHELKPASGIVSAGFDDFRWPHPVLILREEPRPAIVPSIQGDYAGVRLSKLKVVARQAAPKHGQHPLIAKNPQAPQRRSAARVILPWTSRLATLVIALLAVLVSIAAWGHYVRAPWTRDGRIRAQVASVAPQISGQITELRIADNQFVHKGDVLYVIDPFDFEVALRTNTASLKQKAADLQVKEVQSERKLHLSYAATTPEQQQIYKGNAIQAKGAFEAMQQQVAQAEINLSRTQVRSPVNGYVTNLLLRVGDYAHQGVTNVSIIDTDSYWVDGYFEETQMARVCVGDRAEAKLMGYSSPIIGHVTTVTRGVSVSNAAAGAQGLPNVDPVYTWVRLAQRVPVRIAIDAVPPDVPLVSGMTATVTIRDDSDAGQSTRFGRLRREVTTSLSGVFNGPSARPGCIPAITTERGPTQSLPPTQAQPSLTPEEINPGLAPGLNVSPRNVGLPTSPAIGSKVRGKISND